MNNQFKRFLSLTLALLMVFLQMPIGTLAAETEVTGEACIGNVYYDTLQDALDAAVSGQTVAVMKDLECTAPYVVSGKTLNIVGQTSSVTITGSGESIFQVDNQAADTANVMLAQLVMINTADSGHCIDVLSGDIKLSINNCTLRATGAGANQVVTVSGSGSVPATVIFGGCTIDASATGYGVVAAAPVDLSLNGVNFSGYVGISMESGSAGSNVRLAGTSLTDTSNAAAGDSSAMVDLADSNITYYQGGGTVTVNGEDRVAYDLNCLPANMTLSSAVVTGTPFAGISPDYGQTFLIDGDQVDNLKEAIAAAGFEVEDDSSGEEETQPPTEAPTEAPTEDPSKDYAASSSAGKYETLSDALNAADGQTVTLLKDLTIEETISVAGNAVLNLGGYTLTSSVDNGYLFSIQSDAYLRVDGSTGTVLLEDHTCGLISFEGAGNAVIRYGTYEYMPTNADASFIRSNCAGAVLELYNVNLNTSADIITCAENSDFYSLNVIAGAFTAGNNGITARIGSRANIEVPTITAHGDHAIRLVGAADSASAHISGAATCRNGTAVSFEGLDMNISYGYFSGAVCVETLGSGDVLSITGGEFTGPLNCGSADAQIQAGVFDTDVSALVAEGFKQYPDGTVAELHAAVEIYRDGEIIGYESLEEAVADAQSGDAISIYGDVTISQTIVIDRELSLDCSQWGKIIGNCDVLFRITNPGDDYIYVDFYALDLSCDTDDCVLIDLESSLVDLGVHGSKIKLSGGGRPTAVLIDWDTTGMDPEAPNFPNVHMKGTSIDAGSGYGIRMEAPANTTIQDGINISMLAEGTDADSQTDEEILTPEDVLSMGEVWYITGYCPVYVGDGATGSNLTITGMMLLSGSAPVSDTQPAGTIVVNADNVYLDIYTIMVAASGGSQYSALMLSEKQVYLAINTTLYLDPETPDVQALSGLASGQRIYTDEEFRTGLVALLDAAGFIWDSDEGLIYSRDSVQAKLGDRYYMTLEEALEAAYDGDEIWLLNDIDLTGQQKYYEITRDLTIRAEQDVTITTDFALIFFVNNGVSFELDGVDLVNRSAEPGMCIFINNSSTLSTTTNVSLYHSELTVTGAQSVVIYAEGSGENYAFLEMYDTTLSAGDSGTAILCETMIDMFFGMEGRTDLDGDMTCRLSGGTCVDLRCGDDNYLHLYDVEMDAKQTVFSLNGYVCYLDYYPDAVLRTGENGQIYSGLCEGQTHCFEPHNAAAVNEAACAQLLAALEGTGLSHIGDTIGYDYAAKIGDTGYFTLEEALKAAAEAESTDAVPIMLMKDIVNTGGGDAAYLISCSVVIGSDEGYHWTITSDYDTVFRVSNPGDEMMYMAFFNMDIINTAPDGCCVETVTDLISLENYMCEMTAANGNSRVLSITGTETRGVSLRMECVKLNAGENGTGIYADVPVEMYAGEGAQTMSLDPSDTTCYINARTCIDLQKTAADSVVTLTNVQLNATETAVALNETPATVNVSADTTVSETAATFSGLTAGQTIIVDEANETVTEQLEEALEDAELIVGEDGVVAETHPTYEDATALSDFEYILDDENGTVTLGKYIGTGATVVVAPVYTVDGTSYATVLDTTAVFVNNTGITSVRLCDGVAFKGNTMTRLFSGCTKLVSADLNGVDTSGVTDMSYMFTNCSSLTTADMTDVDTSAVTTMYAMFSKCSKLAVISGYENWETGSLQVMRHMFNYVQAMETIDLSKWDLSQVINSGWCFQFCYAKQILLPDNLKTISAGFLNHATKYEGTTFTIPAGVEKIGYAHTIYDFSDDDFVEFLVADGNENYVAIDGILYSADGREMLAIPRGKTFENDTYVIPEGVDFLGELSFSRNYNIHTVVLPNSYEIQYVPVYDPRYILVDDSGNLNAGSNLNIAIYCYTGITDYAVKDDNPRYTSINGIIYTKDMTTVVAVPSRYNKPMNIPEGVITWDYEAMWADNSATVDGLMSSCAGVSIPSTMTDISQDQLDKLNRLNKRFADFEITVHEDNPVYGVDADGYLIVKGTAVSRNSTTRAAYATVAEALAEAKAGERVILMTNCSESRVLVTPGVTLDLSGWTLTADYVVGFNTSTICDSSNNAENSYEAKGLLAVKPDNMVLYEGNSTVPVYNPEKGGFIFVDFLFQSQVVQGQGVSTINLLVTSRTMEVIDLLKDGAADNDIQIAVRLNWDNETGTAYQDFVFNETTVRNVMQSNGGTYGSFGRMFYVNVTGLEELKNVTATVMVISGSNAVDSGETMAVT